MAATNEPRLVRFYLDADTHELLQEYARSVKLNGQLAAKAIVEQHLHTPL